MCFSAFNIIVNQISLDLELLVGLKKTSPWTHEEIVIRIVLPILEIS